MRRFLLGAVLGAVVTYGMIHHGWPVVDAVGEWISDTAAKYQGTPVER